MEKEKCTLNKKEKEEEKKKECTIDEKEIESQCTFDFNQYTFSDFFNEKVGKLLDEKGIIVNKKSISDEKKRIGNLLNIKYETFRKYINGNKKIRKRDCIIAICALIKADSFETSDALKYFRMPELESTWNDNPTRDDIIIGLLEEHLESPLSISDINKALEEFHFNFLDVIDHNENKNTLQIEYPYPVLRRKVECRADELIYRNQYNSLSTEYAINKYRIYATMWLRVSNNIIYKLGTSTNGSYDVFKDVKNDFDFQAYKDIDDTGKYKNYFVELRKMAESEKKKMANILNDTKNYNGRRSAKVIDNEIHVFYEIYNYSIPEKNEYYFMDYVNGKYTLYVSPESIFMRFYLTDKEYSNIYGKSPERKRYLRKIEQYNSIEAMKEKLKDKDFFLNFKVSAFNKIKAEIDSLVGNLKSGKEHIGNFEDTYDFQSDIFMHYKVTEEFKCTYDPEYGEIDNWAEKAKFYSDDNLEVELTIENLIEGFELGLGSIEEILNFLSKHNSLKIIDCIE